MASAGSIASGVTARFYMRLDMHPDFMSHYMYMPHDMHMSSDMRYPLTLKDLP